MEGSTEVATEEESLSLHVDVGGVVSNGGDFVGEENCGGIKMLAQAVSDYATEFLDFFFSHCSDKNGFFIFFFLKNFAEAF